MDVSANRFFEVRGLDFDSVIADLDGFKGKEAIIRGRSGRASRWCQCSISFTFAPATTLPWGSLTVPRTVEVPPCANAVRANNPTSKVR